MTAYVNWREDVACRDADPDLFFPIGTTGPALRRIADAKRICRDCPVQIQCLAWALENGATDGVWGGTTPDERRVIRTVSKEAAITKADGDDNSYHPAEQREHGIRAETAPGKTASILRRAGIGPGAGGTGTVATSPAVVPDARIGNGGQGGFARDFATADGERVMVTARTRPQFVDLAKTTRLGRTFAFLEHLLPADFSTCGDLYTHRALIATLLTPWFSRRTVADLAAAFAGTSVPWVRLHHLSSQPGSPTLSE